VRVTTKGQVTIPIELRHQYGIEPGSEVEFIPSEDGLVLRRTAGDSPGRRLVERLRGRGTGIGMTTDEIMALTRGED